jgi:hypothetical protein
MCEYFDLTELLSLPIPRCTIENIAGAPAEYVTQFVAPRVTGDGGLSCLGCGTDLYKPGLIGVFGGSSFEWGIANGEGHCSRCGYPTRMYHRLAEGTVSFPLQYHPDEMQKERE